ncbi:hypothetical protein [Anaerostipes caccae]|uniref:hypothetical protein n=1 Tax=Anaerostipes caccae TaxID=105841 RepID=UPI0038D3AB7C
MFKIPRTYREEDQDYLTIPPLKSFCNEHGISANFDRMELIEKIEKYANHSAEYKKEVYEWLHNVLFMGKKTCIVDKIHLKYKDLDRMKEILHNEFEKHTNYYVASYNPKHDLKIVNHTVWVKGEHKKLCGAQVVYYIQLLQRIANSPNVKTISFPVFVDLDFENNFVITRANPVSGLYFCNGKNLEIDEKKKTRYDKIMRLCRDNLLSKISCKKEDGIIERDNFKKVIFKLLDRCSKTPIEIQKYINMCSRDCKNFIDTVFTNMEIRINPDDYEDAMKDMKIFIEKYASITYPNSDIFMKDRMAYPIKLVAQDNEFTKIQESTSGFEEPLQMKKAFFDSKKSVYADKKCDKICLMYKKERKKYYGDKNFPVIISVDKGSCFVKFTRFTEEADINNVLSGIIQLYGIQE